MVELDDVEVVEFIEVVDELIEHLELHDFLESLSCINLEDQQYQIL